MSCAYALRLVLSERQDLIKFAIGKEYRSDEGPNVQAGCDPLRADSDPNRCPADIDEIGALGVAGPPRQKHGRVHAS